MSHFSQVTYLPIIFQVDEGAISKVNLFLLRNHLNFSRVLVVSGSSYSEKIAKNVIGDNSWDHITISDNSFDEVERIRTIANQENYNLLIAVGGGKILDSIKRVSYLTRINHIAVPTIISNDGLISPISVLKNESGKTESIPAQMPMGVVIDLDIIASSPTKYLRAAAGDILSNFSATNDWVLAVKEGREFMNDIAFQMSRSSANSLVYFGRQDFKFKPFVRQIVQGQVNSGIAMSLAGSSRPCSGSEHLISHAVDYLGLSTETLHGTQVGTISLFCLSLEDKLTEYHLRYAKEIDLQLTFDELNPEILLNFKEVFEMSKKMRPGKFTVLNNLTADGFVKAYDKYLNNLALY